MSFEVVTPTGNKTISAEVNAGEEYQKVAEYIGGAVKSVTNPSFEQAVAGTAGGATMSKTVSAASTNATSVKASAGQVYGIVVNNQNAAVRYLKLYNKASSPTVGTDTPVKTIAIQPGQTLSVPVPAVGWVFSTGIAFALTTGVADSDTGAVSANEHVVNIDYK